MDNFKKNKTSGKIKLSKEEEEMLKIPASEVIAKTKTMQKQMYKNKKKEDN